MSTLLSAECVGVARWATDTAAEYAKIREQFGRPIGQFQAIKHKCAGMIAETERATAAVWDAARAIDEASGRRTDSAYEFAAAVAATLAPVAAQHCAQDCIQVHGGIGFTWEHDTNVYYRRAIVLAACFGRAADYPQQVVDVATTHRHAVDRHRPRPRHREAARRDPRGSGCAEGDSERGAHHGDRRGRLGAAAPAQAVGPGGRRRSSRSSSPRSSPPAG